MNGNCRQQTPLSLTFTHPWAIAELSNGSGVATMFSFLKSTHVFKQEFSFGLEQTNMTFKLTHITFNHGACSLHLGLEQLKDRTIKSSTMSHVFCSTIILEFLQVFKIKLRDSIVWHSQISQNMWYLWIHTKAIVMLCVSFPTTKAYVELIGMVITWKSILAIHIL